MQESSTLSHDVKNFGYGFSNPVKIGTAGSGAKVVKLPEPAARLI
jgi:hypothetical protein